MGNFLTGCKAVNFSRRNLLNGISKEVSILPSTPWSLKCSIAFTFPNHKTVCTDATCRANLITNNFIARVKLGEGISNLVIFHYAVLATAPSPCLFWAFLSSPTSCSRTFPVCVLHLMCGTKFHTHIKRQVNLECVVS